MVKSLLKLFKSKSKNSLPKLRNNEGVKNFTLSQNSESPNNSQYKTEGVKTFHRIRIPIIGISTHFRKLKR